MGQVSPGGLEPWTPTTVAGGWKTLTAVGVWEFVFFFFLFLQVLLYTPLAHDSMRPFCFWVLPFRPFFFYYYPKGVPRLIFLYYFLAKSREFSLCYCSFRAFRVIYLADLKRLLRSIWRVYLGFFRINLGKIALSWDWD